MHDSGNSPDDNGVISTRAMEIIVAALFVAVGGLVMMDSARVGAGWVDPDGPQAGFFPFRIGLIMAAASAVTLVQAFFRRAQPGARPFVDRGSLKQVMLVLIPAAVFASLLQFIGIYLAAALYITAFMAYLGRYNVLHAAAVGFGVAIALFFMFEVWFLVPLPKGPIEVWFGY